MTRTEHLAWCKKRALELVREGDLAGAVASMTSDMGKHEGTRFDGLSMLAMIGMMEIQKGPAAVRKWVEGFN